MKSAPLISAVILGLSSLSAHAIDFMVPGMPSYTIYRVIEETGRHSIAIREFTKTYAASIGLNEEFVSFCVISLDRQYPMSTSTEDLPFKYDRPSEQVSEIYATAMWDERIAWDKTFLKLCMRQAQKTMME